DPVGLTAGAGLTGGVSVDLSAGGSSGTVPLVFEDFVGTLDLANSTLSFLDNGTGGFDYAVTCQLAPASHTNYGAGCYTVPSLVSSVYEVFPDSPTAALATDGNSITYVLTPTGYVATYNVGGGAAFVAPTGTETVFPVSDDGNVA